jgi:hypothetical protein
MHVHTEFKISIVEISRAGRGCQGVEFKDYVT